MPQGNYERPPITEAVISLAFEEQLSSEMQGKVSEKLHSSYPGREPNFAININVNVDQRGLSATAKAVAVLAGFKLSSLDQLDLILVGPHEFATSRLAPYLGWSDLYEKAKRNLDILRATGGYRNLSRVAVRYVNRVDIPCRYKDRIDPADYIRNVPSYPEISSKAFDEFHSQVIFETEEPQVQARIASSGVPSPLIDKSLMLDIDIYRLDDLPNRVDAIYELLEKLHKVKNSVFENCITDKARELFDRA